MSPLPIGDGATEWHFHVGGGCSSGSTWVESSTDRDLTIECLGPLPAWHSLAPSTCGQEFRPTNCPLAQSVIPQANTCVGLVVHARRSYVIESNCVARSLVTGTAGALGIAATSRDIHAGRSNHNESIAR